MGISYTVPTTTDVWHKRILKRSCQKKRKNYGYLSKLLRIQLPTCENLFVVPSSNHWVTITKTQLKEIYVYLNGGNFEKISLKLLNVIF